MRFVGIRKKSFARGLVYSLLLAFSTGAALAGPVAAWHNEPDRFGDAKWEALGSKKGVKLARKRLPASSLFAIRGEIVIASTVEKVARAIYDETKWTKWSANTAQALLLSNGPDTMKTVYQGMDMPFILSDRDVVYTFGYEYIGDTLVFIGRTLPYRNSPKSVGVRMHLLEGRWFLKRTENNQTHLVMEILMDPKGSLPTWFVNLVQRDYPVGLLTSLARQAKRADVEPLTLRPPAISDGFKQHMPQRIR